MNIPRIFLEVWFIIVGGIIIFFDGRGWCIACRDGILTGIGVICLILGAIGIINQLRGPSANVR
jgi:hypothetical protein